MNRAPTPRLCPNLSSVCSRCLRRGAIHRALLLVYHAQVNLPGTIAAWASEQLAVGATLVVALPVYHQY